MRAGGGWRLVCARSGACRAPLFEPRLRGAVSKFCAALAQARKPYREIEAAESTRVAGTRTIGIVRCDQPRALDLHGRRARRLEAVPDTIVGEVLARLAPLFQ
jgi:hypothetical protein